MPELTATAWWWVPFTSLRAMQYFAESQGGILPSTYGKTFTSIENPCATVATCRIYRITPSDIARRLFAEQAARSSEAPIHQTMTSYPLAQHSWDDLDVITISSRDSQLIGTFPLEFLTRSGVSIWEYICDVVRQLLDNEEGGCIYKPDGSVMTNADVPELGDYCFVPHSELSTSHHHGCL